MTEKEFNNINRRVNKVYLNFLKDIFFIINDNKISNLTKLNNLFIAFSYLQKSKDIKLLLEDLTRNKMF